MVEIKMLMLVLFLLIGAISVVGTVFWIWALVDCATKETNQGNEKIAWILIIVFTHCLGALIYFLTRRPKRIAHYGK